MPGRQDKLPLNQKVMKRIGYLGKRSSGTCMKVYARPSANQVTFTRGPAPCPNRTCFYLRAGGVLY
jgi:hypothetical protein